MSINCIVEIFVINNLLIIEPETGYEGCYPQLGLAFFVNG